MGMKLDPETERKCLEAAERPRVNPSPRRKPVVGPSGWAIELLLPVRVWSTPNQRKHWSDKFKDAKSQNAAVLMALFDMGLLNHHVTLPCIVTLTRIGGKPMDGDNRISGFKAIRDAVAEWLGVSDADGSGVEWRYSQADGLPGCRIRIESA